MYLPTQQHICTSLFHHSLAPLSQGLLPSSVSLRRATPLSSHAVEDRVPNVLPRRLRVEYGILTGLTLPSRISVSILVTSPFSKTPLFLKDLIFKRYHHVILSSPPESFTSLEAQSPTLATPHPISFMHPSSQVLKTIDPGGHARLTSTHDLIPAMRSNFNARFGLVWGLLRFRSISIHTYLPYLTLPILK